MTGVMVAKILMAYLLGSLSGSLLLGRWRHVDIRALGSGNAGGTNAFRTQGWRFGLSVALFDIGKGALAVWIGQRGVIDPALALRLGMACGAGAGLGHVWPLYFGFRGGKGAATLIGALLLLWPWALLPILAVAVLTLGITGYVGLATILAGWSLLPLSWWFAAAAERSLWLLVSALIAGFLLFTHRSNIARLRAGSELRFERVRWLYRGWQRR